MDHGFFMAQSISWAKIKCEKEQLIVEFVHLLVGLVLPLYIRGNFIR